MRIGILGTGGISRIHIKALQMLQEAEVAAVAGRNIENTKRTASEFGIKNVYSGYEELIDRADVDAVINCTPNYLHAPLSIRALERGLNVLCEKPMATTSADAEAMLKAADRTGRLMMIAMCLRFEKKTEAAADIIKTGVLGDIYYVKADFLRRDGQPGGWFTDSDLAGGGALLDIGTHILDLGMYLSGCGNPVRTEGRIFHHPAMMDGITGTDKWQSVNETGKRDVETFGTGLISFDNGITLNLEAGWNQHREKDFTGLEIYGSRGGLRVYPELKLFTNKNTRMTSEEIEYQPPEDPDFDRYLDQAGHFIRAASGNVDCRAPARDGLKATRIIEEIYNCSRDIT